MSTLAEIEAAIAQLPPPQWMEIRRWMDAHAPTENGQVIVGEAPAGTTKPWMELAGCFKDEAEELRRIDRIIADEFERVDPEDWR